MERILIFGVGVIIGAIIGAFSMAMIAGGNPALKEESKESEEE